MAAGDDLFLRLTDFAVRIIRLSQALPANPAGQQVARQIIRSGTSAGANYEEARGAESRADFIHKLGIVLKEIKETRYWLTVTDKAKLVRATRLQPLLKESEELSAIIGRSVISAKRNRTRPKSPPPDA